MHLNNNVIHATKNFIPVSYEIRGIIKDKELPVFYDWGIWWKAEPV